MQRGKDTRSKLQAAILHVDEYEQIFTKWLLEEYNNTPGADGRTPRQRWLRYYSDHPPTCRWTADQVRALGLIHSTLHFRDSGGLLRLGIRYGSDEIDRIRRHVGARGKVDIRVDRNDLSQIAVIHPQTKELVWAPAVDRQQHEANVTEYQQRLVLGKLRERGLKNPDAAKQMEGFLSLIEMTRQMSSSVRYRQRRHAARIAAPEITGEISSRCREMDSSVEEEVDLVTELESMCEQLTQVELDEHY
jgi:hypothetical protein